MSLGGWSSSLGGWRSSLGGWRSSLGGWSSSLGGWRSSLGGWRSSLGGWRSGLGGWSSSLGGWGVEGFRGRRLSFGVTGAVFHPLPGLTHFLCLAKESKQRKARPRWGPVSNFVFKA
ncbi:MAG: hypothetical protein C0455_07705 [Ralstonia sp.]|nr:hypothetical protein [Ralstonia sp.]